MNVADERGGAKLPIVQARLEDPRDPRMDGLLSLYEEAIPARERKGEEAVRAMAASPVHRVGVAMSGQRVVGFFLVYAGRSIALLEYLATAPELRGAGLGSGLYREARAEAGTLPFLVEVDSDLEEAPDRAMRERRLGFYRRLGCRRIEGLDFVLPLPGDGPPPRLDLLVDMAGASVDAPRLASWISEIYSGVYGCEASDPRLERMIAGLPAESRLN